jgi:ATP-binding cassette subfamily C protein
VSTAGPLHQPVSKGCVRTPTILQMEALECGAASLSMVLAYYGRFIPLEQLRTECGVSRDGSNASMIAKAARGHGFESKGIRCSLEELRSGTLRPCILFWSFNHFVVFEGMKGSSFQINDPGSGRRLVDEAEMSKSFTGIALELSPGPDFQRKGQRPSLFRGFQLWLRGNRKAASFAVLCGLLLSIPGVLVPGLSSAFINSVVLERNASSSSWIIGGIIIMIVVQVGLISLQALCINRMQFGMFMVQSVRMAEHMLRLPMRFFLQRYAGDLVARFTSTQSIAAHLGSGLLTGLVNIVTAVVYAVVLVLFDPMIGLIAVGSIFVLILLIQKTNTLLVDRNTALQQDIGKQYGSLMMMLRSIPEIKATSREGEVFHQWAGYQAKSVNAQQSVASFTTWLDAAPGVVQGIVLYGVVLTLGGWQVIEGNLSIGGLVAMQMLASLLIQPVTQLVMFARVLQTTQAQMNRVLDVMHYEADPSVSVEHSLQSDEVVLEKIGGAISVKEVHFGFDHTTDPILRDLSFTLEAGEMIALVGASGSGKSTVLDLLLGLENPWQGSISFDGMLRGEISQEVLTGSLAGASGSVTAFHASLRDNISMWDGTILDSDIVQALHDADCSELLKRPGGLDAPIDEGGRNLSGGQLQRLEIARSLARNPSVLILDGATSALDGETEARVLSRIRSRGCTTILVTERRSALMMIGNVMIAGDGHIIDRGTPDELSERNEWFHNEFEGQL